MSGLSAFAQSTGVKILGNFHVAEEGTIFFDETVDIDPAANDITCDGHLILNAGITNEQGLALQSNAHLDLRSNTEFAFADNAEFANLSLSDAAKSTVQDGKYLWLTGDIAQNSSEEIILEASSGTSYAQLKLEGNYTGTGSVRQQQHLNAGWVMVGASMNNTNAGFFGDVGSTEPGHTGNTQNLFSWDGEDYVNVANNTAGISPGRGYFGFVGTFGFRGASGVYDFVGIPNTASTPTLVNETAAQGIAIEGTHANEREGWNLVANPFTCALDFSELTLSQIDEVDGSFFIYDNNKSGGAGYIFWSGAGITDPHIAPMQSFWVKANGGSPSLGTINMKEHGTVTATPEHLRTQPFDRLVLRTYPTADTATHDYTVVSFIEDNTTMGYDGAWDAIKMANSAINIYSTHTNGDVMAINAIPYGPGYSDKKTVPISFKAEQHGGNYTIRYDDSYMINTYAVYLEDKLEQTFTDLTAQDYGFINDTSMTARFVLHFRAGALSIDAPESLKNTSGITAWVFDNQAYLSAQFSGTAMLSLHDISGKKLQSDRVTLSKGQRTEWPLRADLAAGIYLLRVETAAGSQTIKFTK